MQVVTLGMLAASFAFMIWAHSRRPLPLPSVASTALVTPAISFFTYDQPINVGLFFGLAVGGAALGAGLHQVSRDWGPFWAKQRGPAFILLVSFCVAFLVMQGGLARESEGTFDTGMALLAAAGGLLIGYYTLSTLRPHPRDYTADELLAELRQAVGRRGQPGGDLEPLVLQVYAHEFGAGAAPVFAPAMGGAGAGVAPAMILPPAATTAPSAPKAPPPARPASRPAFGRRAPAPGAAASTSQAVSPPAGYVPPPPPPAIAPPPPPADYVPAQPPIEPPRPDPLPPPPVAYAPPPPLVVPPVPAPATSPPPAVAGVVCSNCGRTLATTQRFCPGCGTARPCLNCGRALAAGQRFCPGCGAATA